MTAFNTLVKAEVGNLF